MTLSVPYPDVFLEYRFLKLRIRWFSDTPKPPMVVAVGSKILMLIALGEE